MYKLTNKSIPVPQNIFANLASNRSTVVADLTRASEMAKLVLGVC